MPSEITDSKNRVLSLGDFDYPFPERLVAQAPAAERDRARLLVRQADGGLRHLHVADLTTELHAGTLLILNDTRVFPSRLFGRLATGGEVELFLLAQRSADAGSCVWKALGRPLKKLKVGTVITLGDVLSAEVITKTDDGVGTAFVELRFPMGAEKLGQWLESNGYIPLPPYIKRQDALPAGTSPDKERYQTVYARHAGSVAAPTAGLHFTESLMNRLAQAGIEIRYVSLHVGAGTFLPVKSDDITAHKMHAEQYCVGRETAKALVRARAEDRPVVAVGTTTLRSLEDLYRRCEKNADKFVEEAGNWRSTELYIYPRTEDETYKPWVIDGLITNFHQPKSTLFMLVSALLGLPNAKKLYQAAIEHEYRLYSYGDASLLWL